MELYFLKDIQLVGVIGGFYLENGFAGVTRIFNRLPAWLLSILLLLLFYCLAEVFNPFVALPLVTWFGLKAYLFYMAISLLLPEIWQEEAVIKRDLMWMALSTVPMVILCGIQYYGARSSWINVYANPLITERNIASQGFHGIAGSFIAVRATGTFSYIGSAVRSLL